MQLTLSHIGYRYPSSPREVLEDVSVTFPQGWTGIVGDNGCGKTTLARVATGGLCPVSGTVQPDLTSVYCEQDCSHAPDVLEDFAYAYDRDALRLRDRLGIEDDWPWRYEQLSCGQQKRLQVAVAIWLRPDVLVVDEPTNHLDVPSREAVTQALADFNGIGILISHDRALLDCLVSRCVSFEGGQVRERPGTYSQAAAQRELEEGSALGAQKEARREQARLERERQRRAEVASRSDTLRSRRGLARGDSDAREKIGRAIVSGKDGQATHLTKTLDARIAAASRQAEAARVSKRYDGDVPDYGARSRRPVLVRLDAQTVPFAQGEDVAGVEVPDLALGSADHVGVVGPNGAGKSTLVRALVAAIPQDVPVVYVPQEYSEQEASRVLGMLHDLSPADRGRVLSVVAQLNSDPEALLSGMTASPGELRKLALAEGVLEEPQLLVMDEPTNHLDLHSVEALERFLSGFPGALVLVSHDIRLVEAATGTIWQVAPEEDGSRLTIQL